MSLALTGLLLLGVALVYFVFFDLKQVHIAALVPDDFSFAVVYASIDDLRESYEAPYARQDADTGVDRIGRPTNVPGLEGVAQQRPVGSYWTHDQQLVWLLPYTDFGAFEEAFFTNRENTRLRPPQRVAQNYLSLSETAVRPRRSDDEPLFRQASTYPIALVGRPRDGGDLKRMFSYLFLHEPTRKPQGVRVLGREIARWPPRAAAFAASQIESLLVGFRPGKSEEPVGVDVELKPRADTALQHALPDGMGKLVAAAPHSTVALAGLALKKQGWEQLGFPLEVGDAAVVVAIVTTKLRARPNTILFVIRSKETPDELALIDGDESYEFDVFMDRKTEVRTTNIDAPARFAHILSSSARKPPAVALSVAREDGVWYCAIGSQAHQVVRHALGCARGATELSIGRWLREQKHGDVLQPKNLGAFVFRAEAATAMGWSMPLFEIRSLAVPTALSAAIVRSDQFVRADLRIYR